MARFSWLIVVATVLNGVAGLALATLRLCGMIDAPWGVVLSPLCIPLAISGALGMILLVQIARDSARHALDELADPSGADARLTL